MLDEFDEVRVILFASDFVKMVVLILNDVRIILHHFLDFSERK